jgi:hypothetical protein
VRVDGLALIAQDDLTLWADPTDRTPGRRSDYLQLEVGAEVLLVAGPQTVDGIDYWQLYPSTKDYTVPLGWAAASQEDGTVNLDPFQPACPETEGVTAAQLGAMEPRERLSCYGDQELTLQGQLTCGFGIADGLLAGPILSSNVFCRVDDALSLHGPVSDGLDWDHNQQPVFTGNYEVSGHFDDPGAQHCYQTPFGTSLEGSRDPGDPGAIQDCRTFFVVTAVRELIN